MISRTTRTRTCERCGEEYHEPCPWPYAWPKRYCSQRCSAKLASTRPKLRAVSPASTAQRDSIKHMACVVCKQHAGHCQPAHLIDRSLLTVGQDEALATIPLCPDCHRGYDEGGLSILEYLEPSWRAELAFAVARHGLLRTLQRVTNQHWSPDESRVA